MQQDDVGTSSCVGNKNQSGSTFEMDQAEASGHRPVSLLGEFGIQARRLNSACEQARTDFAGSVSEAILARLFQIVPYR